MRVGGVGIFELVVCNTQNYPITFFTLPLRAVKGSIREEVRSMLDSMLDVGLSPAVTAALKVSCFYANFYYIFRCWSISIIDLFPYIITHMPNFPLTYSQSMPVCAITPAARFLSFLNMDGLSILSFFG